MLRYNSIFYKVYRKIRYLRYLKNARKRRDVFARKEELKYKKELICRNKDLAVDSEFVRKLKENKAKNTEEGYADKYEINEVVSEELLKSLEETEKLRLKQQAENEAFQRKRRKRLIRYLIRRRRKQLLQAILSFDINNLQNFFVKLTGKNIRRHEALVIFLTSLSYYILAYLILFLITSFIAALIGTFYDYKSVILHFINYYYVGEASWSSDSVVTIFSSGPLIALIIAAISWIIYHKIKEHPSRIKILFIWLSIHGVTFFFGALFAGALLSFGFGFALKWTYIKDTGLLVYSLVSILFLTMSGLLLASGIIISANSYFSKIRSSDIPRFLLSQIVLPFVFGNIILFLYWLPEISLYNQLVSLSALLIILPVLGKAWSFRDLYFEEEFSFPSYNFKIFLLAVLLLISFRIIFGYGITL